MIQYHEDAYLVQLLFCFSCFLHEDEITFVGSIFDGLFERVLQEKNTES